MSFTYSFTTALLSLTQFFSLLLVVPLLLGNSTQLIQLTSNLGVCNVRLKEFQGLNGICIEFEWPSSVLQSTLLLHFICSFRYSKNIYFKYSANQTSLNSSYLVFFNTISFKRIDSIQWSFLWYAIYYYHHYYFKLSFMYFINFN